MAQLRWLQRNSVGHILCPQSENREVTAGAWFKKFSLDGDGAETRSRVLG